MMLCILILEGNKKQLLQVMVNHYMDVDSTRIIM